MRIFLPKPWIQAVSLAKSQLQKFTREGETVEVKPDGAIGECDINRMAWLLLKASCR